MSVAAIHTHGMPIWIHKSSVRLLPGRSVASFFAAASVGVNLADQPWGFLAAAASLGPDVAMDLKGLSLSCPWNFVQLG